MKKQHLKMVIFSFLIFAKVKAQSAGEIIITELMVDPVKVSDASGEWFEVYNASAQAIDMNGWHIKDGGSKNHLVNKAGGLVIQPGAFLLFSIKADSSSNGGLIPDYVYSSFTFANASGKLLITDGGGHLIDSVAYSSSTPGRSWNLDPQHFKATENDNPSNWCSAGTTYGLGDFGTPKQTNTTCTLNSIRDLHAIAGIAVCLYNNELMVRLNEVAEKQQWDIVDISGRVIQSGSVQESTNTFSIGLNRNEKGIYFLRLLKSGLALKFIVN